MSDAPLTSPQAISGPAIRGLLGTLLVLSVLAAGCVSRYKLTLTNDVTITTSSKPKLDKETSSYRFKDAKGQTQSVPAHKVQVIERL